MSEETLSTKVYNGVRNDILRGVYPSREFLSEAQIAQKYGVSKAPVKEALHRLAEQGFLVSYPRKGYMVNLHTRAEINQIQEIRRCLEALCVRRAIAYASDAQIEALRDTFTADAHSPNPEETVNARFHIGLAALSQNAFMPETLRSLIYRATLSQLERDPDIAHFEKIVDAMLARDVDGALQWLERDIVDIGE